MLTFQGTENSEDLGGPVLSKGFVVHKVDAFKGDTQIGYLKISYIPSESIAEFFPTVWHFQQRWRGKHLGLKNMGTGTVVGLGGLDDPAILTEVWIRAHLCLYTPSPSCPRVPPNGLCPHHAPSVDVMRKELAALAKRYRLQEDMDTLISYHLDKPFVDYVRILDPFQGKRLAIPLYVGAAKWLAETLGMGLRASGLRTLESGVEKLWEIMEKNPDIPIVRVTLDGKSFQVLDYTENQTFSKTVYEVVT